MNVLSTSSPNAMPPSPAPEASPTAVRSGRTRLGKRLLLAAGAVLAALAVGEAALRVRQYWRYGTWKSHIYGFALEIDPQTGIAVPKANMAMAGSQISMRVNALGFRGRELTKEKPRRTVRIACLGGSTTYCAEVASDDATWPAVLERLLSERHPQVRFEVINAGIPGCRAQHTRVSLERRVLPLEPDLVIDYEAYNDMKYAVRQLAAERGLTEPGQRHQSRQAMLLSQYSVLFSLAEHNGRLWLSSLWRHPRLAGLPADLPLPMLHELGQMETLLAERRIPLVLVEFLTKFRRGQSADELERHTADARYFTPWLDGAGMLAAMDQYNEALRQFGREHALLVVDAAEALPGDDVHFFDSIHFTDAGCRDLARLLADALDGAGLIAPLVERALAEEAGP